MTGLCLGAGAAVAWLAVQSFTLAWTHTVEKTEWQEDWRVTPAGLVLVESRIQGSGAGMEPPEGARLEGGFWRYRPDLPPIPELRLARSAVASDWRLCFEGSCRPLGALLPPAAGDAPASLRPCPGP